MMTRLRHKNLPEYSKEELQRAKEYDEVDRCIECGYTAPSFDRIHHHEHHVVSERFGGTYTVLLCTECHKLAHATSARDLLIELGTDAYRELKNAFRMDHKKARSICRQYGFTPINRVEVDNILGHLRRIEQEAAEYDLPATHRAIEALLKKFATKGTES